MSISPALCRNILNIHLEAGSPLWSARSRRLGIWFAVSPMHGTLRRNVVRETGSEVLAKNLLDLCSVFASKIVCSCLIAINANDNFWKKLRERE